MFVDTEHGKQFTTIYPNGPNAPPQVQASDRLSEVGMSVLCLAAVRKQLNGRTDLTIKDLLITMQTLCLRVLENAKYQHAGDTDRGEFLYMAPYLEFGIKYWVHLDQLQTQIKRAAHKLLEQAMPTLQFQDPAVITMAHASANDEKQFTEAGVNLKAILTVVADFDSQQLARVYINKKQPGLAAVCSELNIRLIGKHNGGNDAAYSLAMVCAIALWYGAQQGSISVAGNPTTEVAQVVMSLRNAHYSFTNKSLLRFPDDPCEFCGIVGHKAVDCQRRCGGCLKKWSGHTYHQCPELKAQQESFAGWRILQAGGKKYFLLPNMLTGHTKGFLSEHDAAATSVQRSLSDIATVRIQPKKMSQKARKEAAQKEAAEKAKEAGENKNN